MLLPPQEAVLFFRLYPSLIGFVSRRLGNIKGINNTRSFQNAPNELKAQARDATLDHIHMIDAFLEANPDKFSREELSLVAMWKHFYRGTFVAERDLKSYTVFLDDRQPPRAYGVLGLTTEIMEMLSYGTPMYVQAVLLPWKDRIVCDGLICPHDLIIGPALMREYKMAYREAKARGIITSLDPAWRPEVRKPTAKPRTPTILRFLKKCPKTAAEFKRRYGQPRMDMARDAARQYSTWTLDGKSALDIDYLMIYANIIRHQVLYVYANKGRITHVTVIDPTDWHREDFMPLGKNRLLS